MNLDPTTKPAFDRRKILITVYARCGFTAALINTSHLIKSPKCGRR